MSAHSEWCFSQRGFQIVVLTIKPRDKVLLRENMFFVVRTITEYISDVSEDNYYTNLLAQKGYIQQGE